MLRTFANLARFIENYLYYRRLGFYFQEAWNLAQMTLPE